MSLVTSAKVWQSVFCREMSPKTQVGIYARVFDRNFYALLLALFLFLPNDLSGKALLPPCPFGGLNTDVVCDSPNSVTLTLNFNPPESLDIDGTFHVVVEEDTLGTFAYLELPIEITELPVVQGETTFVSLLVEADSSCNQIVLFADSEINCQCEISNVDAEILFCETDTTALYRINNFDFFDVANSGYSIQINEQVYPSFAYDELPLEVSGPISSDDDNELRVFDIGTGNCMTTTDVENVECAFCSIDNLEVEANDCEDGLFSLSLDFQFENISQDGFSVSVNAIEQGTFDYSDLPITFGAFTGEGETLEVTVFDEVNVGCLASSTLEVEACVTCSLSNLQVVQNDCDMGTYSLNLDFDSNETGNDGFEVSVNGLPQGVFDYADLPIDFGAFTGAATNMIEVSDIELDNCLTSESFETLACAEPCTIESIQLLNQTCLSNYREYQLDLNFNSSVSDSFDVFVHQVSTAFGRFAYSQLPVMVNDQGIFVTSSDDFGLEVKDMENIDCGSSLDIMNPIDCSSAPCVIGNIEISATEDDCLDNGTFNTLLNSDFEFDPSGNFFLTVDGGESTLFSYADLPISIPGNIGDGLTEHIIELVQFEDNTCINEQVVSPVLCPAFECSLSAVSFVAGDCQEDGFHSLIIDASVSNPGDSGFTLVLNSSEVGAFDYSDLPLELGSFLGDGQTSYTATITDNDNNDCFISANLDPVACAGAFCSISNLSAVPSDECVNGFFSVDLNFSEVGGSEEGFELSVNETFLGQFPYDVLPLPISLLGNGETDFFIEVVDSENAQCFDTIVIDTLICVAPPCIISNLDVALLECDQSGFYDVEISFDHENGSPAGFKVFLNGFTEMSFSYDDLDDNGSVFISIDSNAGNSIFLSVSDTDDPTCQASHPTDIFQDCFKECFLPETLVLNPTACDENQFVQISLSLDDGVNIPAANDSFTLLINNVPFGNFLYDDLESGLVVGELLGDGPTNYQFVIVDFLNANCTVVDDILIDCTKEDPCVIGNEEFSVQCNEDGSFMLTIGVDITGQSETGVQVEVNDQFQDFFDAVEGDIIVGPFVGTGEDFTVNIFDVEFPDNCSVFFTIPAAELDCSIVECDITDPLVDFVDPSSPCEPTGTFNVEVSFTIQNAPSDSFRVELNTGSSDNIFAYDDDMPFIIGPLVGDGTTEYGFTIVDSQDPTCSNFFNLGTVSCSDNCAINFTLTPTCEDDESLSATLLLETENVGDQGFTVLVNDLPFESQGTNTLSYETDNPLIISGLDGSGETDFVFTVFDNEFPDNCTTTLPLIINEPCISLPDVCVINILDIVALECDATSAMLEVQYESQLEVSDSFAVTVNGIFQGFFAYDDENPVVFLGPFLGDETVYTVSFSDQVDGENCQFTLDSDPLICTQGVIPTNFTVGNPFPNPMQDQNVSMNVGLPSSSELTIEAFNTAGQRLGIDVRSLPEGSHTIPINMDGYIAGLYIIRVSLLGSDGSDFVFEKKVVKATSE